ncbi:Golgi transport complex subunit 6 [Thecaphora frezii]
MSAATASPSYGSALPPSNLVSTPTSTSAAAAASASASSSASTSAAALPASHPISRRIRSILAQPSRNEDALCRNLATLADLYSTDANVEADADADAPEAPNHQALVPVDTERARRSIEKDARRRILEATDRFIAVLAGVDDGLAQLARDVESMRSSCDDVQQRLEAARHSSRYLVEHAEGLERQRDATQRQRELSRRFLERFTLSDDERDAIHSRQVRVGSRLFGAMDHLERIRADCRVLLEGSDANGVGGGTRAATDLMSTTAEELEHAYQKLYRWCMFEFRQPIKEGLEVSRQLRQAVRRLMRARGELLRDALSTLVATRSAILMKAFVTALTVGGPAPTYLPRPIEVHAHDPIRYVGDMLAWMHQTLASEREFLTALFGEQEGEGGRRIGQRRRGLEGSVDLASADLDSASLGPGEAMVREVLNRNLEGCCRPLKIRVEQTVRSQEGSVTTYRLAHLVEFYRLTMEETIGTQAALSRTLREVGEETLEAFLVTLDRQAGGLARFQEAPEASLAPPPPLVGVSSTLKELLAEYERSLADGQARSPARRPLSKQKEGESWSLEDFEMVLQRLVDPMLDLCGRMAEVGKSRPRAKDEAEWEAAVFLVNCYGYIVNLLQPYPFTSTKVEQVQSLAERETAMLTDKHSHHLLHDSGLSPILDALSSKPRDFPLSHYSTTTPAHVALYLGRFNDFLASTEVIAPERLGKLQSPQLRNRVHQQALGRLVEAYGRVVEEVRNPRNRYEWTETLVRRSREEVEMLLAV